jgi:hypothetical protein
MIFLLWPDGTKLIPFYFADSEATFQFQSSHVWCGSKKRLSAVYVIPLCVSSWFSMFSLFDFYILTIFLDVDFFLCGSLWSSVFLMRGQVE